MNARKGKFSGGKAHTGGREGGLERRKKEYDLRPRRRTFSDKDY